MKVIRLFLAASLLFIANTLSAQVSVNYSFITNTTGSLLTDKSGNAISFSGRPNLLPNGSAFQRSTIYPIGFDFVFMGKLYTHFVISSSGQLALGISSSAATILDPAPINRLTRSISYPPGNNTAPVIAPFWAPLRVPYTGSTAQYVLTGTAPYRCLVVQWNVYIDYRSASTDNDGIFQCRLYEGSGEIEYIYGKMFKSIQASATEASIGFTAGAVDNSFIAIKSLTTLEPTRLAAEEPSSANLLNTSAGTPLPNLHSTADGSRRRLSFLPVALNGSVTNSFMSSVYARSMQLNWRGTFNNHLGYLLYRSVSDSVHYELVDTLPATETQYLAKNLLENTRYYWKVVPFTEGASNVKIVLTDSTRCIMEGSYAIGAGGRFNTIQEAQDSLTLWGIKNNVSWDLLPSYNASNETYPIRLKGIAPCQDDAKKLTLRPAPGATINFSSNSGNTLFIIDSVKNFVFDGRAEGTSVGSITIQGTGDVFRMINCWKDTIRFVTFSSAATNKLHASLSIESSVAAGSHSNMVSDCRFTDWAGNNDKPFAHISGRSTAVFSRTNTIIRCEFSNFRQFAVDISGKGWTIAENSFFATTPISGADESGFIRVNTNDNSSAFQIIGNYFGGTGPSCSGNAMTFNLGYAFAGVQVSSNCNIGYNQFKRINLLAAPVSNSYITSVSMIRTGPFSDPTGTLSDTIHHNIFGAESEGDSITVKHIPGGAADIRMIRSSGHERSYIDSNSFAQIHTNANNYASNPVSIITCANSQGFVRYNKIGSDNHSYRIIHTGPRILTGIEVSGNTAVLSNIITNLASQHGVSGITSNMSSSEISGNIIRHLKNLDYTFTDGATVSGIFVANSSGQLVYDNRIINLLDSTRASGAVAVGIMAFRTDATIGRNLVADFMSVNPPTIGKSFEGISVEDGKFNIHNNMVRLGLDSAGNAMPTWLNFGITVQASSSSRILHNTVYITGEGEQTSGYCLSFGGMPYIKNNIFVNDKVTGPNYTSAIYQDFSNCYADYNIVHNIGDRFFADVYGSGNPNTFKSWQNETRDPHSYFIKPVFRNAKGPTRLLDLHLIGETPAERRGTSEYTTIEDFDAEIRSALSPVDIGADAGNFIFMDIDAPVLQVTPLPDATDTSGRYITITIQDSSRGIANIDTLKPTIWYRKVYPAVTNWQFGHGTLVEGNVIAGKWKFYIDHQSMNVSEYGSDSIQYYFVAQDAPTNDTSNIAISPAAGASHTSVISQVTAPTKPYTYRINVAGVIMPSIVEVGEGKRYTSLTNDGGLFEGFKKDSVSGDIVARISSHLMETGKWSLDSTLSQRNIRLTVVPAHDSVFVIANKTDLAVEMIRVLSYSNLIIDGSYNGSGRWLRFINRHSTAASAKAAIALFRKTDSVSIRNIELQGNSSNVNSQAMLLLSQGVKKNISITGNLFTNITGSSSRPSIGVLALLTENGSKLTRLTVNGNHFVNIQRFGVYVQSISEDGKVDSNHFYWTDPSTLETQEFVGIALFGSNSTYNIQYNYFGGTQPGCGGNAWVTNGARLSFMNIQPNSSQPSVVAGNVFRNVNMKFTNTGAAPFFLAGAFNVNNNVVGDSTKATSILIEGGSISMINTAGRKSVIEDNLIAGITINSPSTIGTFSGIIARSDSSQIIRNNVIRDVFISSSPYTGMGVNGISITARQTDNIIEGNQIFNISNGNAGSSITSGIETSSLSMGSGKIQRNRIYQLYAPNTTIGTIAGINCTQQGKWKVENNQIAIDNGSNMNGVYVYGILDTANVAPGNSNSYTFNSIFIGGTQNSGNHWSYAIAKRSLGTTELIKNNLLVNVRTGGSGIHGIFSVKRPDLWLNGISNFNFFIVRDSTKIMDWQSNVISLSAWRAAAQSDHDSYFVFPDSLPPAQLFEDLSKGDLNINTTDARCWYLNGRGLPLADVPDDYNGLNTRSTNMATGPVDIGSHEFNTSTLPLPLQLIGRHQHGSIDTLGENGRIIATIEWGNTGTLPQLGTARFYPGSWPNDPTNGNTIANARPWSAYLQLPVTGGADYTYKLTMYYDSSMMGKVTDLASMVGNKRQINTNGSWQVIQPSIVNAATQSIVFADQTSFSEFTVTDANATLASGTSSAELRISALSATPTTIAHGSTFTVNFTEQNAGTAVAGSHKTSFYLSSDLTLTPGVNGDLLLGSYQFNDNIAAGGNSGNRSQVLTMPCTIAVGNYYLLAFADADNVIEEPNEQNNLANTSVNITAGLIIPAPLITATPSATVCAPSVVTLSANVPNCETCAYSWSNGASGKTIMINSSGSYSVAVSNACGSATATQVVTINSIPSSPSIFQSNGTLVSTQPEGNIWYLNGAVIPGATGSSFTPAVSGVYAVSVTLNGCTSAVSPPFNYVITSVNDPVLASGFKIGPNPADDHLNIMYNGNPATFTLLMVDLAGKQVISSKQFNGNTTVDLGRLAGGMYILKIRHNQTRQQLQHLIMKR